MRKEKFLCKVFVGFCCLSLVSTNSNAQQWLGSSTSSGTINRYGDVIAISNSMGRVTLGDGGGAAPHWGGGYLGINLRRENTGLWSYLNNGAENGGIIMMGSASGLLFSLKSNTGASSGSITDANVADNIKFRFNHNGTFESVAGDLKVRPNTAECVTLGASWGGAGMSGTGYIGFNLSRDNVSTGNWPYYSNTVHNGGGVIYGNIFGDMVFSVKPNTGSSSGTLSDVEIMQNGKMMISGDGKVVIGEHVIGGWGAGSLPASLDYSSNNYRLFVEKGILTERVRVAIQGSPEWADYVFDDDYKLMPLKQLEAFISKENHLPDVPTTTQVMEQGVDLGQMQAKLLQKVEELTLYILQQQKQLDSQERELELLKKRIKLQN